MARPRRWSTLCASPWAILLTLALLAATVLGALVFGTRFRLVVGFIIQPLAMAALLLQVLAWHRHWLYRWLSWRWVAFIGTLSYGMYLIHMAVIERVVRWLPRDGLLLRWMAVIAGVLLLAYVMHRVVERPFLALKGRWGGAPRR